MSDNQKPSPETIEAMRNAGYNRHMSVSEQRLMREAVRSGQLDSVPSVKEAVARCAEGHERRDDRSIISQHVHRISPKYDD